MTDTISNATQVMEEQRTKGLLKYGVSIEAAPLTVEELIRHAQEEMADGLVYTTRLPVLLKQRVADERATIIAEVLQILSTGANMDIKEAQIRNLAPGVPMWHTLYAQPSVLRDSQSNLVTLTRAPTFPFTAPVMVRA